MANTILIKRGSQENVAGLTLEEGELALAYNDDKTKVKIYAGGGDGTPVCLNEDIDLDAPVTEAKEYTDSRITELIGGAPETMDTLKELGDLIKTNEDAVDAIDAAITNKADKTQVVFTNSTPTVQSHGGIPAGTTFDEMPITDVLNKILYPWVAPVVSAKVAAPANGGVFEKGNTQTVTSISVTVTKKSAKITKIEVFNGSTSLGSKTGTELDSLNNSGSGTFTFAVNVKVSANGNFTVKVTDADDKVTTATTGTFTFVYPYYQGVVAADATVNEAAVKALTKIIQTKGTKTVAYTASNQKMVFVVPVANGPIKTITDQNGFNVTGTFAQSTISITGLDGSAQQHYVYVSDPTTVSSFKMTFAH